ncbi:hypothetical protein PIB30_105154 [Stylosanthes scabra]|uniref:Uncharacterized protein n=1 Tax=Stylosanthes scabra TaxID=79078 RepID=A0ABU6YW96_9FABA|nr:hypothetical protein [Stylosanthes scabra]
MSELVSSTVAAGSVSNPSQNMVTSNTQNAAAVSTATGSIRSTSETEKKQLQDGKRTPLGGNSAQTPLRGGNHERGPRPRVEQPPPYPQTTAGWNVASTTTISPLSTAAVRQLIEESHLDLVNLLTSHLTTVLNPIVADSNAKYDQLAKRFDNLLGVGDVEGYNLNQAHSGMGHESVNIEGSLVQGQGNETLDQTHVRVIR